ncbi:hypothetical protein [Nocardia blacklockiae]|uniref:hypothetical protein n=1 Tax=Nocardia blacklockiae TaxID=480036 RepID=UPI0018937F52|nr:hypothetical protein [Nocardia blacklockiae]MBF6171096.1 hypothetical protein [Nocardia blacklockiae]
MPDDYDATRRGLSNYERGLFFEIGRARICGETPERGWVRQFAIKVGRNTRVLDSARTEGRGTRNVERKSGRINERETRQQLKVEREALNSGQITHSRWETVAGEKIPATVLADIRALQRDFPGRFHHEIISRADALRAIELGRSLVSKQLELVRAYELDRADRARKRLANIREIIRQREAKAKEERERGERERKAREERVRVQARAAREAAREFPTLGELLARKDNHTDEDTGRHRDVDAAGNARERETADLEAENARKRAAAEAARKLQREAADRLALQAQRQRELAAKGQPGDMAREVSDLMRVTRPTPGVESPHREPPEAGSTRGGREERGRERKGQARTRT